VEKQQPAKGLTIAGCNNGDNPAKRSQSIPKKERKKA
jgi:hypothetical protein